MKYLITSLFCLFAISNARASIYIVETSKANLGECTGTITINATGEAGPFTFDIVAINDTEGTVPSVNNVSGVFTIKGLCPGSYSITQVLML